MFSTKKKNQQDFNHQEDIHCEFQLVDNRNQNFN